jgi:hypothetical protein
MDSPSASGTPKIGRTRTLRRPLEQSASRWEDCRWANRASHGKAGLTTLGLVIAGRAGPDDAEGSHETSLLEGALEEGREGIPAEHSAA